MSLDSRYRTQVKRAYKDTLSREPSEAEIADHYRIGLDSASEVAQRLRYTAEGLLKKELGDEDFYARRVAVEKLYRELFKREPDYPALIEHLCSKFSIEELREAFLESEEYR